MTELRKLVHSYAVEHTFSNRFQWIFPIGQLAAHEYGPNKEISPVGDNFFQHGSGNVLKGKNYFIAVKELIIEWQDYQNEVAGIIYCSASSDTMRNTWIEPVFQPPNHRPDLTKPHTKQKDNFKQLLHFVKPPGRKTTFVKIPTDEVQYTPIDLRKCPIYSSFTQGGRAWAMKRFTLECELKSLFDENEILPIKNAHMTVEIVIK